MSQTGLKTNFFLILEIEAFKTSEYLLDLASCVKSEGRFLYLAHIQEKPLSISCNESPFAGKRLLNLMTKTGNFGNFQKKALLFAQNSNLDLVHYLIQLVDI